MSQNSKKCQTQIPSDFKIVYSYCLFILKEEKSSRYSKGESNSM